jgi:hypothetical protein
MRIVRPLLYVWALPATMLGLLVVLLSLLSGGRVRMVQGVLEVHGGFATWFLSTRWLGFGWAAAMTLGHVILGRDPECLERSRRHEHVHVRQYERWGPLMLPIYLVASLLLWIRGRDPYLENPFEVEAYGISD